MKTEEVLNHPDYSQAEYGSDRRSIVQCPKGHFVYFSGAVSTAGSLAVGFNRPPVRICK